MKIRTLQTIFKDEDDNIIEDNIITVLMPEENKGIRRKDNDYIFSGDDAIYLGSEDSISNYEDIELENETEQ